MLDLTLDGNREETLSNILGLRYKVDLVAASHLTLDYLRDGENAALIDFSLSGIASPYFDLAGMFASFTREGVRKAILAGFEDGYEKRAEMRLVEPYFALGILLFICQRYEAAKHWDWFPGALVRWQKETFAPLTRGESFLAF